jgi:hypothetical protein
VSVNVLKREFAPLKPVIQSSTDSSVGIALGYRLDDRGSRVRFSVGAGNFSLHNSPPSSAGVKE